MIGPEPQGRQIASISPDEIALAEHAEVIRALGKRMVGDVIEIGRRLTDAKLRAGHGRWLSWLEEQFEWKERTARNFMQVHEMFGKSANFADLSLPVSGLYLLIRSSTPLALRDEIVERAESGEQFTHAQIKEMIDAAVNEVNEARGRDQSVFESDMQQAAKREAALRDQLKLAQTEAPLPGKRYGTIVIDPPWPMKKIERELFPDQMEFDYPTMDYDALCAFRAKFELMAAKDCHVFMWTTHKFLPWALRLFDHYDVRYVLTMVWHKAGGFQPFGLPQYNCEFVVYGHKGSPKFIDTKAFNCCFTGKRAEHSRKPDEFYDVVRRVTGENRIDVFSREPRPGFDQYGNEPFRFSVVQ